MRILTRIFDWYFSRTALPYWCIVVLDLFVCFFGGLFAMWLLTPASTMMAMWTSLFHTFLVFGVINLIGFRTFHTYSGILRYSQFVDLMRVIYASALSFVLALAFNHIVVSYGLENIFHPFTGSRLTMIYLCTTALMCASRILIKLLYDNLLIGNSAENAMIYGTHAGAIAMTNELYNVKPVKFIIVGYIGDSKARYSERLMGKRIYSTQQNLKEIIKKNNVKALLVSPLKHEMFVNNHEFQDLLLSMA